jgi:hypothetical protein
LLAGLPEQSDLTTSVESINVAPLQARQFRNPSTQQVATPDQNKIPGGRFGAFSFGLGRLWETQAIHATMAL